MTTTVSPSQSVSAERWTLAARVAFRFVSLYLVLFCLLTQIFNALLPIPNLEMPSPAYLPPFRQAVTWVANHVFGYTKPLVYVEASGDKVFDWVFVACILALALVGSIIWSILDRRRPAYTRLSNWLRVFLRFALAGQMFTYGWVKVFPMQMPFPPLMRLVERFGDFSPMGVLWSSVGASPAYERFVGSAELLAGVLLVIPVTSKLGALICLIDMIEVFMLNMTYDVPVKLFSFHLILFSAFLLLPERTRLLQFCFLDCPVGPARNEKLFSTRRANRIATALQILFGALLFFFQFHDAAKGWKEYGGGAPKSPLYGIWNVDVMTINGQPHPPLLTDNARYRYVIFDYPQLTVVQHMDDKIAYLQSSFDPKTNKLTLSKTGEFTVARANGRLTLDGHLGHDQIHIESTLLDCQSFLLVSRGFHWVQEFPFNR